jgi:tape measure domain-containing protein
VSDFEVSAKIILDGLKDLVGQLQEAGKAGGQVFGESLSTESQKRLDGIVRDAETAAKRVGLAFNKTKLRFEDASGKVVPDEVFNRLAKLDKGLRDANKSLGQFAKEMEQAATGSISALRTKLSDLTSQLERVAIGSRSFRKLKQEIAGVENDLRRAGDAGGVAAKGIGLMRGAMALVGGFSAAQFLRSSIDQAIQLESATRRLSNTLGQQGAGQAMMFLKGVSDDLGLSFRDLVNAYGSFTAAATAANVPLQQQNELFTAVSRAGQSLGISADAMNGSFLALQQIASKGTVSMEELRGQLGERLPIALAATAKGLGISMQAMIKLVETGQLSANKFFPAFTKGLNDITKASSGMPTAAQNIQQFKNEWESLQAAAGQSVLPALIATIKQLNAATKDMKAQQEGIKLGMASNLFTGLGKEQTALLNSISKMRQEYGLSEAETKKIYDNTVRIAGVKKAPIFGNLIIDAEAAGKMTSIFGELAKNYRQKNKDSVSAANAEAAALTAVQNRIKEQIKAQQESNALAGQRTGVAALEKEAELVGQVTAGKMTQADADKAIAAARRQSLQEEIRSQDLLIAKIKEATDKGAEGGGQKALLAAQSVRAQKVLEMAKLEAEGSRAEVQRRQEILQLAQTRLQITQQQVELENTAGQLAVGRLRAQQQVADALMGLQQAQQGLSESLFAVDSARQNAQISGAEQHLQLMRDRGAAVDQISQQEEHIKSLKRGAETIEYRALEASIAAAQQRFELERQVLELKQAQQVLEAQGAQRAAAQNTLQQQQRLLELQGQMADPSLAPAQRQALEQQVALQRQAIGYAQQQQQAELGRLQALGLVFGLERQALVAQQQTTANGLKAQAATKGWEQSLTGPLTRLDASAGSVAQIATELQAVSAGFISAGGQTIQIQGNLDAAATSTASAADAAGALAAGYADANANAGALLETLKQIATVPQARWAGGGVEPGTRYKINELGQESFLNAAGSLSLINAPRNGYWTPPTAGTVLPAGITASLAAGGAFGAAGAAMGRRGGGGQSMAIMGSPRSANIPGLGKLNAAINRLTGRMDALVAKDFSVRVVLPSNAGILRSIGGY